MVSVIKNKKRMRAKAKYILWYIVRAVIIVGICYVILYPFLTKIINGFKSYDDLIDPTRIGLKGSPTHVKKSFVPQKKSGGIIIKEETVEESAAKLISILSDTHVI